MSRKSFARNLRGNATDAEQALWFHLRNRQLLGLKFRRQQTIQGFIADFACVEARLVIELDGGQHAQAAEADRLRTDALAAAGYVVLRFWNNDVLTNVDGVLMAIVAALDARSGREVAT